MVHSQVNYSPEEIAEFARIYGEISVFYRLIEECIEPAANAEKCLSAIRNYKNTVPRNVRQALGINLGRLEEKCVFEASICTVTS